MTNEISKKLRVKTYRIVQGPHNVETLKRSPWGLHIGAGRTVRAHAKAAFQTKAQAIAWHRRHPSFAKRVGIHGVA